MSPHDRQWWFHRQRLDALFEGSAAECLAQTGWCRSVGGVNPYLALFARTCATKPEVDRAAAEMELYELPSARGCTYVVPRSHFAMALTLAQGFIDKAPLQTAVKFLGVTEAEIEALKVAILDAMGTETLTPSELRDRLGDQVRNLGEAGKKRGQTTTLSLGLAPLQTHGLIVRVPVDGGLETQRYGYRRWEDGPFSATAPDSEEAMADFARLYFAWAGPATLKQFQWITARTVAECKAAVARAGLAQLSDGRYLPAELLYEYQEFKGDSERVVLVGSLDNLFHLRSDVPALIDDQARGHTLPTDKGFTDASGLRELTSHGIVCGGRLIGVWEYEPSSGEVVAFAWEDRGSDMLHAVAETQKMVRAHLGDCRSFSLDSPSNRQPRIDRLRELASGRAD